MSKDKTAIVPTREQDYPEWYQEVIKAAELAENAPVRGCMVIKPWGYAIWENMKGVMDKMFKDTGHENAYFPLFIPLSFLEKEAEHVEGFAKECAVVTHHRLEKGKDGKLIPAGPLEEPIIVRPTSETIIGEMFSRWISSYRDLPLLINQWANVVRWEMRTRIFLRTTEFLWQEGHTAHATQAEAEEETLKMLNVYAVFCRNYLALPVIKGEKTESERFPGAEATYTIEAMMQDRKALQGGTSHFLGQKFAKASEIKFSDQDGELKYAWTTSWGSTTRLIGAMVMVHSDDDGFICPPHVAPLHIVILPVLHKPEGRGAILTYCHGLMKELQEVICGGRRLVVKIDEREMRGGDKTWNWIKKGVPIRLEVGLREVESDSLSVARRNHPHRDQLKMSRKEFVASVGGLLDQMHEDLYAKALKFREDHTKLIKSKEDFYSFFSAKNEIHGGFALVHWCGDLEEEEKIKKDLTVSIRCIPLDLPKEEGRCFLTGKPTSQRVIFAKAY
jgi:prolyl-tRNA synthetase